MKPKSILFGALTVFIFILLLPYFFIAINKHFNLPIIENVLLHVFGVLLLMIGIILSLQSFYFFKKEGRGTPVPIEPPKKFVKKGLYKYSRNPMYIGYFSFFLGIFFVFGQLMLFLYVLIMMTLIHVYVVKFEEPKLHKRFGKEYQIYVKKVPRWI